MSLSYPMQRLSLAEFESMNDEHLKILHQFFEVDLPDLVNKCNELLTAETAKHRTGRPDVLIMSTPLLDYDEIVKEQREGGLTQWT